MYHYTSCGLDNVWLINGYYHKRTAYGDGVAIEDVDGLHRAIALRLIAIRSHLSGDEFRFLRKELELSQKRLAQLLGNDEQTVALWEKQDRVPQWADRWLRALYKDHVDGKVQLWALVEQLSGAKQDETTVKLTFEDTADGWQPKAA